MLDFDQFDHHSFPYGLMATPGVSLPHFQTAPVFPTDFPAISSEDALRLRAVLIFTLGFWLLDVSWPSHPRLLKGDPMEVEPAMADGVPITNSFRSGFQH